jgi:bacterioferritin
MPGPSVVSPASRPVPRVTPDPRLRGYLVRALGHETGAVQLYMAQAILAEMWGLHEQSRQFRTDGLEELDHVERVMRRLLEFGLAPPSLNGPPVRLGRSVEEMLLIDREMEVDVIRLYEEARLYSARIRDHASEELFAGLLGDELEHLAHIDVCLDKARSGGQQRGQE